MAKKTCKKPSTKGKGSTSKGYKRSTSKGKGGPSKATKTGKSKASTTKGKKKTIKGYKILGKSLNFVGKWSLKGIAKGVELGGRATTSIIKALAENEQAQVIGTTGGLIAASVACPPIALGIGGVVAAKYLANKILGKAPEKENISKGGAELLQLGTALRETILLGNRLTKTVCEKAISPAMKFANEKAKDLGEMTQSGINYISETDIGDVFDRD